MNMQSATLPKFFHNDLIGEIFSALPSKSVLRFRCVSKSCDTLISDSTFVKLHLKKSKARDPLFTLISQHFTHIPGESPYGSDDETEMDYTVVPYSINSLIENTSFNLTVDPYYELKNKGCSRIVGTCNGLICLAADSYTHEYTQYCFCLWNPSTKKISHKFGNFSEFNFPRSADFGFAFGCDDSTDIYKVVAFRYLRDQLKSEVRVLNLGDDVWRNIESFPLTPLCLSHGDNHVYLSGTINWLAIHDEYWYNVSNVKDITVDQFVIVSLDLGTETYNQYRLPPSFDEVPPARPIVGVLEDCLCFCYCYKETDFIVWQMKKFGVEDSWTQFLRISYHSLQIDYDYSFEYTKYKFQLVPLLLSEDGDTLIMKCSQEHQAILYNRRCNTVERTNITTSRRTITDDRSGDHVNWEWIKNYVESLVSIF
ncbi:F-box/kelch-repeat protein At3g23880 [Medicago truncatula]|uniref:F-box protein interaction domain protein n=2 Tax=Medicago truncatula TaxID=3880 RepID=G7L6M8_MEDTR|nr:F-box/kelch-repeat protein At3g23880 [Medicago truncatula]AES80285.2 F-box protein interaction domain protein [Medicago truncatula]